MATIGKIRKHSTLLLILVGGALALFVLSDFFGAKRGGGRKQKQIELAVVNGEKIHAQDFYTRLEEQVEMYKMQYGENLRSNMVFQIKEEVLNEMLKQTIFKEQYKKIGLNVSQAEMVDMMTGVNIHPIIRQNFVDPQTGQFNPSAVINYLNRLDSLEEKQQNQWYTLEKLMKEDRYNEKYQNLVKKGFFIPKAMAASKYQIQGRMANIKVISLKFSDIPDDSVQVSDNDFSAYYEKHKQEFEQEETRLLDYVIFDIVPSEKDLEEGKVLISKLYEDFAKIPFQNSFENYSFANLKSDLDFNSDTNYMKRSSLPVQGDTIFNMPLGSIVGPFSENNSYFILKLLNKAQRADSINAGHILIAYKGAQRAEPSVTYTKEQAQAKADSLLKVVRGKDSTFFANIAVEFSTDPSAKTNGGDLGWFADGQMVPEFTDACQNARVGEYIVVESAFGFHVIRLKGKKAVETKVKVAMLKYSIDPSNETIQKIYTQASKFAGDNKTAEAFNKAAEENGYVIRTSDYTGPGDYSIPGIEEGREIVRWSFGDDIESGAISSVFEFPGEDKNVVVLVRVARHKGIAPLDEVKKLIEPLVKREKKADILFEKMSKAKAGSNSLEDIAAKLKIEVVEVKNVSNASPNVPLIGPEPKLVGTIFGTDKGKMTRTVRGDAGIYIAFITEKTEAPETTDYSSVISSDKSMFENRVGYELYPALQKKADVKDNRIKFY